MKAIYGMQLTTISSFDFRNNQVVAETLQYFVESLNEFTLKKHTFSPFWIRFRFPNRGHSLQKPDCSALSIFLYNDGKIWKNSIW